MATTSDDQQDIPEEVKAEHNPPRVRAEEIVEHIQMYLDSKECEGATVIGIVDVDGSLMGFSLGNNYPHKLGLAITLGDQFRYAK